MAEQKQFYGLAIRDEERARFGRIQNLEQIAALASDDFIRFCGYLYQQSGYTVFIAATAGDGGVDLILREDAQITVAQCVTGVAVVDQLVLSTLYSTMVHNSAQTAALLTPGRFSAETHTWATNIPIDLVDGPELEIWTRQIPAVTQSAAALDATTDAAGDVTPDTRSDRKRRPLSLIAFLLLLFVVVLACSGIAIIGATVLGLGGQDTETAGPPIITTGAPDATATPTPNPTPTPTVAVVATTAPAIRANVATARLNTPPQIDGDLAEWLALPSVTAPFVTEQEASWDGSMDIFTIWRAAWDDDALYLSVIVQDDTLVQTQAAKFAYRGDSIELQFDTDLNGDLGPQVSPDDFQYVVSPGNFGSLAPGVYRFQGDVEGNMNDAPGTAARVAAIRTDDGYILELAIPWSDMGVTPEEGLQIGAALSVNDNDTPGTAIQELMLSHVPTRRWLDPTSWGTLTLE